MFHHLVCISVKYLELCLATKEIDISVNILFTKADKYIDSSLSE